MLCALRFRRRWYFRESFLQSISTFLFLTFQRTLYPLLFYAVFPPFTLWYFPIFPPSDSLSIICFPVFSSPGSSSFPSPMGSHLPYCISNSLYSQIMLPSLFLLNDHKMDLCAQHLRCSHCRRLLFSLHLFELSLQLFSLLKWKLGKILFFSRSYHWKWQGIFWGVFMQDTWRIKSQTSLAASSKKKKKRLSVAQREDNIVLKQGQLEVIKLLANQEISRN